MTHPAHTVDAEHLRQALGAIDALLELCWSSDRWTEAESATIEQAHALQEQLDAAYWEDHPFGRRVTLS
jgi:hypothetical protein